MRTLDETDVDLMATLQGWSRAIQGRDGLSHMFRAKVAFSTDSIRTLLVGMTGDGKQAAAKRSRSGSRRRGSPRSSPASTQAPAPQREPGRPAAPGDTAPPEQSGAGRPPGSLDGLLDYLLKP